jgi:hypothetical protein
LKPYALVQLKLLELLDKPEISVQDAVKLVGMFKSDSANGSVAQMAENAL